MAKRKEKRKLIFVLSLSIITLLGFIATLSLDLFNTNIQYFISSSIFIVLGIGMIFLGGIHRISNFPENGISTRELTNIITIFFGFIVLFFGAASFAPNLLLNEETVRIGRIVAATLAIIIDVFQTWSIILDLK